jgi:hypothetical protein
MAHWMVNNEVSEKIAVNQMVRRIKIVDIRAADSWKRNHNHTRQNRHEREQIQNSITALSVANSRVN